MGKDVRAQDPPELQARPPRPRRGAPRRPSRIVTIFSILLLIALWAWALAWLAAGASWRADLLANLAAQGLIITMASALLWLMLRRRVFFVLAALACLMHVWILATGRGAIMPRGFDPAGRVPGAVRMFHYNASHKRPPEEVLATLRSALPDVASIAEPSVALQTQVIYGDALETEYPYRLRRQYRVRGEGDRVGAGVVLSRWPLEQYPLDGLAADGVVDDIIAGVLTVPGGAIGSGADQRWGLIAIHPRSPRSAERWAHGNEVVGSVAIIARKMQSEGLPVVVLADLNSTPSGWRSRELFFEGGLRRGKPLLSAAGTYPAVFDLGQWTDLRSRWPMTIAIDDVFVSGGVQVRGWTRLDAGQSDHWPVVTELVPALR